MASLATQLAFPLGGNLTAVEAAEAYARMLKHLLPPGLLWRLEPDSLLCRILLGAADELGRISERAAQLIAESDPRTTTELLPDFEEQLALTASGTLEERRARVVGLLIRRQRFRPADFQLALAALLGQAEADVVVIENDRAHAVAVNDDREIFRFFIYRDPTDPGTYDLVGAQELVDKMKPTHTAGHVIESISMLCDDEFSLCDRDRLGV